MEETVKSLQAEKVELEQRLAEAYRAVEVADTYVDREVQKIKANLEQEYKESHGRGFLGRSIEEPTRDSSAAPVHPLTSTAQVPEEIKRIYRTEMDRLYRTGSNRCSSYKSLLFSLVR